MTSNKVLVPVRNCLFCIIGFTSKKMSFGSLHFKLPNISTISHVYRDVFLHYCKLIQNLTIIEYKNDMKTYQSQFEREYDCTRSKNLKERREGARQMITSRSKLKCVKEEFKYVREIFDYSPFLSNA